MNINKYLIAFTMGLSSGITYALLTSTLVAYMQDFGISLTTIGLLSLCSLPYSLKCVLAPFVDNVHLIFFSRNFGQRKEWMFLSQCSLIICFIILGLININNNFGIFCIVCFVASFFASIYDIALEGYRIEMSVNVKLETVSMFCSTGFRIGLIISGAIALYMSSIYSWRFIFISVSLLLLPGLVILYFAEDLRKAAVFNNNNFVKNFKDSFFSIVKIKNFFVIVIIVAFYKVSDSYLDRMIIPFLTDVGFSKTEIASVAKTIGIVMAIFGTVVGSILVSRFGPINSLFIAEIFASITNLFFICLNKVGYNTILLALVNGIENFCGGICNIVIINYVSILCNKQFTATHYAILYSISSITRSMISSSSGWVASTFGWNTFFVISSIFSLPSLIFIYILYIRPKQSLL